MNDHENHPFPPPAVPSESRFDVFAQDSVNRVNCVNLCDDAALTSKAWGIGDV